MTTELDAFCSVDFDWTRQLRSIWRDPPYHIPSLHKDIVSDIQDYFTKSTRDPDPQDEPLGRIIVGPAGLGKTHLIGELRRQVWQSGGSFIMLDFVGIKDFWPSVALGYLNSLQTQMADGRTQYDRLILNLASSLKLQSQLNAIASQWRGRPRELVSELVKLFVGALANKDRQSTLKHQDVIRAIVLLISDDLDCASVAHGWLQGMELDQADLQSLGFKSTKKAPIEIVKGISWLLSLAGPTLIAIDQIDAIVSENNIRSQAAANSGSAEQQREAQSIVEQLAAGLMDLHEVKMRAVTVVACLEVTWKILQERATVAATDRYRSPAILRAITSSNTAQSLVGSRLRHAYAACNFQPPYETWPFAPAAFDTVSGYSPRQLLKACEDHRLLCVTKGYIFECISFEEMAVQPSAEAPKDELDDVYVRESGSAAIAVYSDPANEDQLRHLIADTLTFYARHLDLPDDIDVAVQEDPNQRRPSLHGRLSFTFHNEGDREQHYCFRVLGHTNAIAFQSRLRSAMTASGVDRALKFRHLFILRSDHPPSGPKTAQLVTRFTEAGGMFIAPTHDDLRKFVALRIMSERNVEGFEAWLRARKPLFDTAFFESVGLNPPQFLQSYLKVNGDLNRYPPSTSKAAKLPVTLRSSIPQEPREQESLGEQKGSTNVGSYQTSHHAISNENLVAQPIPVGRRYERGALTKSELLSADLLPRHIAILAGSGSGKTVLLRRIVEEAALLGIPAIVLDTNNDLARLGDQWPRQPADWTDDAAKAKTYFEKVEVVVWTPGRNSGRPISLGLLPDFAALGNDDDELSQATEMARATLIPWTGSTGAGARLKEGVLADALRPICARGRGVFR